MEAVEFTTDHVARVAEREVPTPLAGEALIRISSAGICGSDLTALRGVHPFRRPPLISGHEGGGVGDVGPDMMPDWVNRPVALEPQRACGAGEECVADLPFFATGAAPSFGCSGVVGVCTVIALCRLVAAAATRETWGAGEKAEVDAVVARVSAPLPEAERGGAS